MPVQILDSVHLVASGWLGCSLTDPHDCHVFLVDHGATASLIDAGCGVDVESIVVNIRKVGMDPRKVGRILLTHAHADHAAGAKKLSELLEAEIWASPRTAAILGAGDENAAGLTAARAAGIYPEEVRLTPTLVDRELEQRTVTEDGVRLEAMPTPGHSADHMCFLFELDGRRVLFSGDLVFSRGRVVVLGTPDTDVAALRHSIDDVAELEPDLLLPGHGSLVLDRATDHLMVAQRALSQGSLPPGLLT